MAERRLGDRRGYQHTVRTTVYPQVSRLAFCCLCNDDAGPESDSGAVRRFGGACGDVRGDGCDLAGADGDIADRINAD